MFSKCQYNVHIHIHCIFVNLNACKNKFFPFIKHKHHRAEDYRELVMDLTAGTHTDSLKVKIILSWISKQSIGYIQFNPPNPEPASPNGYMLLMQNDQGTYPVFFALLCR